MRPEKHQIAMSALDQFWNFCATIAHGIAGPPRLFGPEREDRDRNEQRSLPSDDQRAARPMQSARDDEKRAHPPSGHYPAVWPR
jgi:hypothetical protein